MYDGEIRATGEEPFKYQSTPELSDWECLLFGSNGFYQGIVWRPEKGHEPNAFWRMMQFLIFGNRWRKRPL